MHTRTAQHRARHARQHSHLDKIGFEQPPSACCLRAGRLLGGQGIRQPTKARVGEVGRRHDMGATEEEKNGR